MSTALDLLSDACVGLPHTVRKMFGGHGFFAPNGGMFAGILSESEAMLKFVEGPARTELIGLGGHPWTYGGQAKPMTMQEWIVVPEQFFDDPEVFASWAKRAHAQVPPKKVAAKKKDDVKKVPAKPTAASKVAGKKVATKRAPAKKKTRPKK